MNLQHKPTGCVLTIKKDNINSEIVPLNDYVQIYEPALPLNDIMAIAEEFVRTHPKEIIILGSTHENAGNLARKLESVHRVAH